MSDVLRCVDAKQGGGRRQWRADDDGEKSGIRIKVETQKEGRKRLYFFLPSPARFLCWSVASLALFVSWRRRTSKR